MGKNLEAIVNEVFETENGSRKCHGYYWSVCAIDVNEEDGEGVLKKLMYALTKSTVEPPNMDFDNSAMMKAVRLRIPKPANSISENTFVAKYVAPITQAFVDNDVVKSDFPNTESTTQKRQGLKADRPDIRAMAYGNEVCWSEVTGPAQETFDGKSQWDTYRLVRFGKAFLDEGNDMGPFLYVIYSNGSYLRLCKNTWRIVAERGRNVYCAHNNCNDPVLFATIPTLLVAKADIQRICDDDLNGLKRSWSYKDLKNAKTRLV